MRFLDEKHYFTVEIDTISETSSGVNVEKPISISQICLKRAMRRCKMVDLPTIIGNPFGMRTSGNNVCSVCENVFYDHPVDPRIEGTDGPFLIVLCDGRRVKL